MARRRALRYAVIIPLYNHATYIEAALSSVFSQTRTVDQIVLIDDGSSDDGFARAQAFLEGHPESTILRQENAGAHATLNRAISMTDADVIAVLNSDDAFIETKIARCDDIFRSASPPDLIFGGVKIIDDDGHIIDEGVTVDWLARAQTGYIEDGNLIRSLLHENFAVTTSNFVFRRSLWERCGGFQPLRYCHDLEFLMAASTMGIIRYDSEQFHIQYRVHPNNTIKEALARVHVEIAAVIASALRYNSSDLIGSSMEGDISRLAGIIESKNLSNLVSVCSALLADCGDRVGFFNRVTIAELFSKLVEIARRALDDSQSPQPQPDATPEIRELTIAIELSSFDKGGLEKVVLDSAVVFKQRGHNPIIVSVGEIGHLANVAASHGIEVVRLPASNREVFYAELLQARSVDIAMSHFSSSGYECFAKAGIPNITFIHNVYAMLSDEMKADFFANDRYVSTYISVSQKASDYAHRCLGVDERKIITIPNGLILSEHERRRERALPFPRQELGLEDEDYVFLNVASYNLHKAHYLMAEALSIILRTRSDIKIVCVGNEIYPPHVAELRQHIQDEGLDRHMLLPGYYADVAPLHKMADAFLLPSFIEGWSIAMNEAMFYGKPLLMTDTGGASEVIINEDIGIVIPNEYGPIENLHSRLLDQLAYTPQHYEIAQTLAEAMMRFADNRPAWQAAGNRARIKVLRDYDFSQVVDSYIKVAMSLCKRRQ